MSAAILPAPAELEALLISSNLRAWLNSLAPSAVAGQPCASNTCTIARWVSDLLGLPLGIVNVSCGHIHLLMPGGYAVTYPSWVDTFIVRHDDLLNDGCVWLAPATCLELLDDIERLVAP